MTQADEDDVLRSLKRAAKAGDVAAARELRAWRDAAAARGNTAHDYDLVSTLEELSEEGRARLYRALLDEALLVADG